MKLASAGEPSAFKALVREASAAKAVAAEIAVKPALKSAPFIVARTERAAAVKPVEPRAGADKHATREPLRSVVAVGADWRRANVSRAVVGRSAIIAGAHSHAHKHSLRVRKGREEEANPE
jgi:hypothetical protein